jgi:hypothetical protein
MKTRTILLLALLLTARQVVDGVNYGMQLYRKAVEENSSLLPIKDDFRSYSWGFSQGGSVALAVHRHIEENNLAGSLHFQGSVCGDGPYDLISTMRYYFDDNGDSYGVTTEHRHGMDTTAPHQVLPLEERHGSALRQLPVIPAGTYPPCRQSH